MESQATNGISVEDIATSSGKRFSSRPSLGRRWNSFWASWSSHP